MTAPNRAAVSTRLCFTTDSSVLVMLAVQILRVNWARIALLTRFVCAVSAMASALRLSIVPLIDSIATELITEPHDIYALLPPKLSECEFVPGVSRLPETWSSKLVNVQRFMDSKYFARHLSK